MIQWAHENHLKSSSPTKVVFIDTGWASSEWAKRVDDGEALALKYGFEAIRTAPKKKFVDLMRYKKGFPYPGFQWCSTYLKGLPFLDWIEEADPHKKAWVLIGKWSGESRQRKHIPSFIPSSEYHNGRFIWHPLTYLGLSGRNDLIARSGFDILPHRSMECSPCINANRADLRALSPVDIERCRKLEFEIGKHFFRPRNYMGAEGVDEVIRWARSERGQFKPIDDTCSHGMCGN